jgi:hypothetical protein
MSESREKRQESSEPEQPEEAAVQIPDPEEKEVRENEPGIGGGA